KLPTSLSPRGPSSRHGPRQASLETLMRPLLPLCAGGLVLALIACSAAEDPEDDSRFTETLTIWADEDLALAMQTFAEAFTGASDRTMEVIMVEHEELRSSFMSTETGGVGPDI